jgi:TolB protein
MFKTVFMMSVLLLLTSFWAYTAEDVPSISFSSNRSGNFDIYTIDINGENLRNITDSRENDAGATWSPDGRFFAYHAELNGNVDIYVMDLEGKERHRLTNDPWVDMAAAWSPDGQWIAFCSDRSGSYEIYKMDVRGKHRQRLTRLPGSNTSPAWSPDSQRIVFDSFQGFRKNFLYIMNSNGENLRQLIKVAAGGASWSPDGRQILFSTTRDDADGEDTFDLFITDLNGQEPRQLTRAPKWELNPVWSPNSQWITFEAREPRQNATSAIYVMNAADGELRQLTDELSMNWGPAWVPVRRTFPVQPSALLLTSLWGRLKQE